MLELDFTENKDIKSGFVKMSDEEYFSLNAISNSDFRLLANTPKHLEHKELFKLEGAKFVFGSALHTYILEPEEFNNRYAVEDFEGCDLNKNTKAYKEAKALWLDSVNGRDILSKDDFTKIKDMALRVNTIYGYALTGGYSEIAMLSEINCIPVKGKVDYINHEKQYIIDLKTTPDIKKFGNSMVDYNYISQVAFYKDITDAISGKDYDFYFLLVETVAPYNTIMLRATSDVIEIGRDIYGEMLDKWAKYKQDGTADMIKPTILPEWFLKSRGYLDD